MSERECFYHPYTPYHIQLQLMHAIYETLQDPRYKIGLFESPTGTGKTLSLICSTMTWLREYKRQGFMKELAKADAENDDDDPEWVKIQYKQNILSRQKNTLRDYEVYLNDLDIDEIPVPGDQEDKSKHRHKKRRVQVQLDHQEDDFLPADYHSDAEPEADARNTALSNEIKSLLFEIEGVPISMQSHITISNDTKIYYSSRTHSQLSQFASQLETLKFPSSFEGVDERLKYLPLGSRKQYCINDQVNNGLKSVTAINEECLDLIGQKDKGAGCQYYPRPNQSGTQQLVKLFTDLTFQKVHDIEDLASIGSRLSVCPYYSVRSGVDIGEVISLPYQLLLEKTAREKLALNVDGSIIIIDEAHNLIDTIQAMNSTSVSLKEIREVTAGLAAYFSKFKKKFNSGNRINIAIMMKILKQLQDFLESKVKTGCQNGEVFQVMDIYDTSTTDLANFYKLEKYLLKSKLAYKLENYMHKEESKRQQPLLFKIVSFLKSLSNPSAEGKFYFDRGQDKTDSISMKYILLDPAEIFRELVDRSKCIILAGGTMEPMDEYKRVLFPQLSEDQINKFSCDHIIPHDNLEAFIVPTLTGGSTPFEFTYKNRTNVQMFTDLADLIIRAVQRIPDGVIVFFPSYSIASIAIKIWRESGQFHRLNSIKPIFHQDEGSLLQDYTESVNNGKGGILVGVMNGKLSEGINFNDKLCRCVFMCGLPYPNEFSSEMILKKQHLYKQTMAQTKGDKQASERVTRDMIDNMTMRIVNQSCGRCIRHAGDYSLILLCDTRYTRLTPKLSKWIRDRINTPHQPGILPQIEFFFRSKA